MKRAKPQPLPQARKDNLVLREIPGELLVYDLKRHKAFCLNETAASVWKSCNGQRTVSDLADSLAGNGATPVDEKIVWLALDQLEKSNLLHRKISRPTNLPSVSRRGLIRLGLAGAIALPIVTMIAAPTAQAAGTPITDVVCTGRHQSDPGGCGTNPCSPPAGAKCIDGPGNTCKCA
ncbi:MAG: PqqD family protein [Acidobacteriota bacterium]